MWLKKALNATSPPAEAPIPTIGQQSRFAIADWSGFLGEDAFFRDLFGLDLGICQRYRKYFRI